MIGEAVDLDKQLQILNRTVRWRKAPVHSQEGDQGRRQQKQYRTHDGAFVPRQAKYHVHHEAVLEDVSAGRTRFEEHEDWDGFSLEGNGLGVCLNGKLIQLPGTPLLTRIGQETDNQESRSAEA